MAIDKSYVPGIARHPGNMLKRELAERGMSQGEFATRADVSEKLVSQIITGKVRISVETAQAIEAVLGIPASVWNNLQLRFDENDARIKAQKCLEAEIEICKKINYREMQKLSLPKATKMEEKVVALRGFFGVASLNALEHPERLIPACACFRSSRVIESAKKTPDVYHFAAWCCAGQRGAVQMTASVFSREKLRNALAEIRECSRADDVNEGWKCAKALLLNCGIKCVLVPYIKNTYINGATWWHGDNPVIVLNVRTMRQDVFWFTLLHEIAHILRASGKNPSVSFEKGVEIADDARAEEREADQFATDTLIAPECYRAFVERGEYGLVEQFAKEMGIGTDIVVGRLLHDKVIDYTHPLRKHLKKIEIRH